MTKSRSNATAPNAKGTLVVGSGTDASTTLAVGTNNYVLTADSAEASGLKWAAVSTSPTFVGVKLYLPADQTISNAVAAVVAYGAGSESIDTDGFHDTSTNNSRITIPAGKGGKYLVIACCHWVGNGTGYRELWVQKGASGRVVQHTMTTPGTAALQQNAIGIVDLAAGDYIQMYVEHNSGGNLNINGDYIQETRFEAYLIGA